ncbi:MAG: AsmA family protein [Candidatus Zixiibacteriota bacterium]
MKKVLKIFKWVIGIIFVILLIAIAGLWLFFPIDKAKQLAVDKGSKMLGRTITVEDADISFWGGLGVELINVSIDNPPESGEGKFLRAENIDVKLQMLPLLSGNYHIDKLIINHPEISMIKQKDGTNNYTFKALEKKVPPQIAEKITPEAKAAAFVVTFDMLEINNGILTYLDDSAHMNINISGLELSTYLESPRHNFYKSSGDVSIESLIIQNDIPFAEPLTLNLEYQAEYDINSKSFSFEGTELVINGIKFKMKGEAANLAGKIKSHGNMKSEKISVADLLQLLPRQKFNIPKDLKVVGDLSLDIDIEYDQTKVEPLKYFGNVIIYAMDIAHNKMPVSFKFKKALIDLKNDNLRLNILDGRFDGEPFKGYLIVDNFDNPTVKGELAGKINLIYLKSFIHSEYPQDITGIAGFDLKISCSIDDYQNMNFSGNLAIEKGSYNSTYLLEPIKSFALDIYFNNKLINVKKFSAVTQSGNLSFNGRLNDIVPYLTADSLEAKKIYPTIDGSLYSQLNLSVLSSLLPPKGNPHLKGLFEMDLKLDGSLTDYKKFHPRGTIAISNASYTDTLLPEPIKKFEAKMSVTPDTIFVNSMNAEFESSDVAFKGQLINPFPYLLPVKKLDRSQLTKPLFLFSLSSKRFNTDKLFPEAVPGSGDSIATASMDSVSVIILPDIDGQGTFNIDTLIYSMIEFTRINGKVKIFNRQIECYDITGKVYSGDVAGKTTVDLSDFNKPEYVGEFKASQVEANDFMSRFTKLGGHLFGKVDLNGSYNAVGWESEDFLNSLTLNSTSTMQKGKLVTSGVMFSVINGLASNIGESFAKEQPLRDLSTNIRAKDGKVNLDKLTTRLGSVGDFELDGFYAFAGDIDYKGSVLLTKEWTEKLLKKKGLLGNLAGLLTDKSIERVKLPIVFGGTMENPTFNIDYSSLTKNVGKNIIDDAVNRFNDLIKKKDKK